MAHRFAFALAAAVVAASGPAHAADRVQPELGVVRWGRDLDAALERSRASGRPVLALFDEVPGCATCVGFGQQVLSHPLLAEAIETEFVPLFVANNRPGRDAELLARFGEPAWNNPVVRFLDARGRDVLERRDGLYSPHEIAVRLVTALRAAGRHVPLYLALSEEETQQAHRKSATFAMGCFWEGEERLGAVPGVLAVSAVHLDPGEGVRVEYDESRLSLAELQRVAAGQRCSLHGPGRGGEREAVGSDHLHALARSRLRALSLTPMQAMRVNSALALGGDALAVLSPSQRERAAELSAARAAGTRRGAQGR